MKTIKEWFESVENETLRKQLLNNMFLENSEIAKETLHEAIGCGFFWDETLEGQDYWGLIRDCIVNEVPINHLVGEFNQPEDHETAPKVHLAKDMTLLDWFAGMYMMRNADNDNDPTYLAKESYEVALSMLEEKAKHESN